MLLVIAHSCTRPAACEGSLVSAVSGPGFHSPGWGTSGGCGKRESEIDLESLCVCGWVVKRQLHSFEFSPEAHFPRLEILLLFKSTSPQTQIRSAFREGTAGSGGACRS